MEKSDDYREGCAFGKYEAHKGILYVFNLSDEEREHIFYDAYSTDALGIIKEYNIGEILRRVENHKAGNYKLKKLCEIYNRTTSFFAIVCDFDEEKDCYTILREDGRFRVVSKDDMEVCWLTTGTVFSSVDEYIRDEVSN